MSDTNNNESNKRKLKVLEHKLAGESSRDIAKTLKVSHSTVQRDYRKAIEEAFGSDEEAISFVRNKVKTIIKKKNSLFCESTRKRLYVLDFMDIT